MGNTTQTPNMGLNLPVPGSEPGPAYASDNNAAFTTIDGHNHTPGSGVPIPSAGINISSALPFNGNNATGLNAVIFNNLGSPLSGSAPYLCCIYTSGGNLYYNDVNGNQIQVTAGGAVNATASGITNGTASASFSAGVLVVDSNTNTPGNVQCGSVLIGNNSASSKFATVSVVNSLGSNYNIVLPNAQSAQSYLAMDTSGNITGYTPVTVNNQISSSSTSFSTTSKTLVNVTNLSVTITTSGRPVMVGLQSSPASGGSAIIATGGTDTAGAVVVILRGGTQVMYENMEVVDASGGSTTISWPTSSFRVLDTPSAGTYTYTVQVACSAVPLSPTTYVQNAVLFAYELK